MPAPGAIDVAIIGAGVVGCAIARSFAIRGWSTLVVEKAATSSKGASKGNSALLHNGYDEPPGSVERAIVRAACDLYRRIHHRMNLPLVETGALVVAWSAEQRRELDGICDLRIATASTDARVIGADELREREPHSLASRGGRRGRAGRGDHRPWSAPLAYHAAGAHAWRVAS